MLQPGSRSPEPRRPREPSLLHCRVARAFEPSPGGDLLRYKPRQRTGPDRLDPEQYAGRNGHADHQPDPELSRWASPATPPRQDQRATGDDQGAVQLRREVKPSQRGKSGDHTQRRRPQVGLAARPSRPFRRTRRGRDRPPPHNVRCGAMSASIPVPEAQVLTARRVGAHVCLTRSDLTTQTMTGLANNTPASFVSRHLRRRPQRPQRSQRLGHTRDV